MKRQKAKIGVKDLKARKDVKGGTARPQNQYTNQPSQPISFGGQYTNQNCSGNSTQSY